ncbi:MAG TPA: leucyl/phenylalanyl-tRNA--protein transferase [Polyangiaceae bacterium]|nr:leucyl/phenylalanyl-tRNA--protein transferase [Polyangiaceae bacterium]
MRQWLESTRRKLSTAREHGAGKAQRLLGRASTLLTRNPMGGECGIADGLPLNVDQMLLGYMQGLFPMDAGGKLRWRCPHPRFALPLAELRVPADLERVVRSEAFEFSFDRSPREVLESCARDADTEWLSERLKQLYLELFELGVMHSVEARRQGELVGGCFGMSLGKVWTHEACFERVSPAADSLFVYLARHLTSRGYTCIEGQVHSAIMAKLGGRDMPIHEYRSLLARGLVAPASLVDG